MQSAFEQHRTDPVKLGWHAPKANSEVGWGSIVKTVENFSASSKKMSKGSLSYKLKNYHHWDNCTLFTFVSMELWRGNRCFTPCILCSPCTLLQAVRSGFGDKVRQVSQSRHDPAVLHFQAMVTIAYIGWPDLHALETEIPFVTFDSL